MRNIRYVLLLFVMFLISACGEAVPESTTLLSGENGKSLYKVKLKSISSGSDTMAGSNYKIKGRIGAVVASPVILGSQYKIHTQGGTGL